MMSGNSIFLITPVYLRYSIMTGLAARISSGSMGIFFMNAPRRGSGKRMLLEILTPLVEIIWKFSFVEQAKKASRRCADTSFEGWDS